MKLTRCGIVVFAAVATWAADTQWMARVRVLEQSGDAREARRAVESALRTAGHDATTLELAAHWLDARRDAQSRVLYQRLAALGSATPAQRTAAARRLVELDLIAGDRSAATSHIADLRKLGVDAPELARDARPVFPMGTIEVPGPLRGFQRMAALAPDIAPDELMLSLAHNIVTNGYQAISGGESLDQTEYLKLVLRYLAQARELDRFSGDDKTVRIESCDSDRTAELLKILGFRLRGACGGDVALETVNASRAFLTMDSGFPLAKLEQALRTNQPFAYDFHPTRVNVVFGPEYWLSAKEKQAGDFIDMFLNDPAACRLYLGLAKLDPDTAALVKSSMPMTRVRAFAHVFDFFGGMFRVRDGVAVVPGGAAAAQAWADLVGVSPDKGVAFLEKLVTRDDAWLASYFDSLGRVQGPALDYFVSSGRLARFYAALRGKVTSPGPARPVFRANTDLLLLVTRIDVVNGKPRIPGSFDVWKRYIATSKGDAKLAKAAPNWSSPDDLMEALFGLARKAVDNRPLKAFLALSDFERARTRPLESATVERLLADFPVYGTQYALLSEAPELTDATIVRYLDTARAIDAVREPAQRADAAGSFQALAALWQIAYRNRVLDAAKADSALAAIADAFAKSKLSRVEQYDATRTALLVLAAACGAAPNDDIQERLLELVAGTLTPSDADTHAELIGDLTRVFEAQKLVSFKALFDLDEQLARASKADKVDTAALIKLAARVTDLNLPKPALSAVERGSSSYGYWADHHVEIERKLNLRAQLAKAQGDKFNELRGQLLPLLRDSLVGLVYAYYTPPGAQVLYTNPLFVRSHDFVGWQGVTQTWRTTELVGAGWPTNAGGRLAASLTGLPYALAEAEQNFLIPTREQALIWGDLVPQLLVGAKSTRWWLATPTQLHWVGVAMRLGEARVAQSALDKDERTRVLALLDRYMQPTRLRVIESAIAGSDVAAALEQITPSELYLLGVDAPRTGFLGAELARLAAAEPERCRADSIAAQFGTPKPSLANTYAPRLLHLRTFPTLMGYSSRLLAESWESNNLYFAALADELMLPPAQLNLVIPQWTRRSVEQIFATHLEDWPALLRAMRVTAEQARAESRKLMAQERGATQEE